LGITLINTKDNKMRELSINEVSEVSGGVLFLVVPAWAIASTLLVEGLIITAVFMKK
jgi:hypothetical protein